MDVNPLEEFIQKLPRDVQEWIEAHPEVADLIFRSHLEGWSVQRLLAALHNTRWYRESKMIQEMWERS